jgi:hypothetical protein
MDAFYHSYVYDAENRISNVTEYNEGNERGLNSVEAEALSSVDSINWDNDAFYSYYAHGPLARTVLGQQQVRVLARSKAPKLTNERLPGARAKFICLYSSRLAEGDQSGTLYWG